MSEITIGADPEIFLQGNNNHIVPCVGILPGTKEQPAPLPVNPEALTATYGPMTKRFRDVLLQKEIAEQFRVQEDNVMAEFNIPPVADYQSFDIAVLMAMGGVKKMAVDAGLKLSKKPFHTFTEDQLTSPQAQLIGCEPDYDAYNGGTIRNNAPAPGTERSCGGHIHVGGDFNCPDFVACLFIEASIISNVDLINSNYNTWYRMPGSYRPKPYGIEYRTPSNEWIWTPRKRVNMGDVVLRTAQFLTRYEASRLQRNFRLVNWVELRAALIAQDIEEAHRVLYAARKEGYEL